MPHGGGWEGGGSDIPSSNRFEQSNSSLTRSGHGSASLSSGNGAPRDNLAGYPLRCSLLTSQPPSSARLTRQEVVPLARLSRAPSSAWESSSPSFTASTVARMAGVI